MPPSNASSIDDEETDCSKLLEKPFSGEEGHLLPVQRQVLHDLPGAEVPPQHLREDLRRAGGMSEPSLVCATSQN